MRLVVQKTSNSRTKSHLSRFPKKRPNSRNNLTRLERRSQCRWLHRHHTCVLHTSLVIFLPHFFFFVKHWLKTVKNTKHKYFLNIFTIFRAGGRLAKAVPATRPNNFICVEEELYKPYILNTNFIQKLILYLSSCTRIIQFYEIAEEHAAIFDQERREWRNQIGSNRNSRINLCCFKLMSCGFPFDALFTSRFRSDCSLVNCSWVNCSWVNGILYKYNYAGKQDDTHGIVR